MKVTATYPSLKGRVVIITGGGQGLGRCYAEHFAQQGAIPVVVDFSKIGPTRSKRASKKAGSIRSRLKAECV